MTQNMTNITDGLHAPFHYTVKIVQTSRMFKQSIVFKFMIYYIWHAYIGHSYLSYHFHSPRVLSFYIPVIFDHLQFLIGWEWKGETLFLIDFLILSLFYYKIILQKILRPLTRTQTHVYMLKCIMAHFWCVQQRAFRSVYHSNETNGGLSFN